MKKVFIDGSSGTTGLRLLQRLSQREDIELLEIDPAFRKDPSAVREVMSHADFTFLCLPDAAAIDAAELFSELNTRIIDTSTAHRTLPDWAYGFPELSQQHRHSIEKARLTATPGCHASGFISLIYPLIQAGVLEKSALLSCTSLTGYSGGGKKMIEEYQSADRSNILKSPYEYALAQAHKHMPEIISQCTLETTPIFMPVVGDFYSGMLVSVPVHKSQLKGISTKSDLLGLYKSHYNESSMVKVMEESPAALYAGALSGRDDMEIYVCGNDQCFVLCSLFDNLGKGASGAAIQCFNIMCGLPENTGLNGYVPA